jgi:uncharacterized protein YjbI with pentapeptide repeats
MFLAIDRYIIQGGFPYLGLDFEDGWFGIGLNWLTFEPKLWSPRNSPLFNQIAGLVVLFLDVDGTDKAIEQFTQITTVLQGTIVFFAGIWFSWASDLISLRRSHRAFLIILVFTCPTLVFLSGHWTYSYVIGVLGLPLGITLIGVLQGEKRAFLIGGIGTGLLAANSYPSALISFLFLLTLLLQKRGTFVSALVQWKVTYSKYQNVTIILLGVCAGAFTFGAYFSGFPIPDIFINLEGEEGLFSNFRASQSVIFGLVFWLAVSVLVLLLARTDACLERFLFWMVSGFIVGNSVLLPWYFHGWREAEQLMLTAAEAIGVLVVAPLDHPWLLVVWFSTLSTGLVLCVLLFGKKQRQFRSSVLLYGAVFALIGTISILFLSAGAIKPVFSEKQLPGFAERVFMSAIPVLTIGWVFLCRSLHGAWLRTCQITLVLLSLLSLGHFYQASFERVAKNKQDGIGLDQAIGGFFEKHPYGRLVCVNGSFYSRYCGTMEAYNRYRDFTRLKWFGTTSVKGISPTWRLFDGRVIGLKVAPIEETAGEYNASIVEERLTSCNNSTRRTPDESFCYGDYVRRYPELLAAFIASDSKTSSNREVPVSDQSIEQWGRTHYHSFGQIEDRKLPTPLEDSLLVVTFGGAYRDNLIRFFVENQMTVIPLWRWWELDRKERGESYIRKTFANTGFADSQAFLVRRAVLEAKTCVSPFDDLSEQDIRDWDLAGKCFSGADLNGSKLIDADLRWANFRSARLMGAKLSSADLTESNLTEAFLYGADIMESTLVGAELKMTNLWGALLNHSDLRGADLSGAKLWQAQLIGADLRKSNLTGADFSRANLTNAKLDSAILDSAIFCDTTMPDGMINNSEC